MGCFEALYRVGVVFGVLAVAATLTATPATAQTDQQRGDLFLAGGVSAGPTTTAVRAEAQVAANRGIALVLSARKVNAAFACDTFIGGLVPCEPDGTSIAGGLRVTLGETFLRPYVEVSGGVHGYDGGDWRPLVGGHVGLSIPAGSRTRFDIGYELHRLQATWVAPSAPGSFRVSDRHITHGFTLAFGIATSSR